MSKWPAVVSVAVGASLLSVDVSIVNVALPAMTTRRQASLREPRWVIDVNVLVPTTLMQADA